VCTFDPHTRKRWRGVFFGCTETLELTRRRCAFQLFFSVLGEINTWVQHLYSVPHDTGDKPQTGGNTSSGVFCVLFGTTTGRRGDSKSCWVVPGRLALTCRCACQIAQVDVRAKNPRYISTPPMFPNPVGLVRATGDVRRHGCDI